MHAAKERYGESRRLASIDAEETYTNGKLLVRTDRLDKRRWILTRSLEKSDDSLPS
jgi:hypothetical protein